MPLWHQLCSGSLLLADDPNNDKNFSQVAIGIVGGVTLPEDTMDPPGNIESSGLRLPTYIGGGGTFRASL